MTETASQRPPGFESTRWSLVAMARSGGSDERRDALEQLLAVYYPALHSHLTYRMRLDAAVAEDVLQSFIVRKVLERDLVASADPRRGRLRSLLLKSLENFARTELVRERKRHPLSLDDDSKNEPAAAVQSANDPFDVAWARSVLVEALCRMWGECQKMGRKHIWAMFEARVIGPALGRPAVPYEELVARFRFHSPHEASNALMTAKRQFQRMLRGVVAESVESEAEIDSELADLGQILAGAAPDSTNALPRAAAMINDEETGPILMAIDESNPRVLANLMALRLDRDSLWNDDDLAALLKHQLAVPLNLVFASLGGARGRSSALLPSFGSLLTSRFAALEVLDSVKRAARSAIRDETVGIPQQIAALLYFASIALAMIRHDERITKSDDSVLRYGFQRMLEQPWLSKALRQLFTEALKRLAE